MKKFYLSLLGTMLFGVQLQAQCTDLFFSEYIEGSSNNKAIEIYNPTDKTINLSGYRIYLINNGGTANDIDFKMVGTLAPYGVYVIGNIAAHADIQSVSDTVMPYNSVVHFNGDDALVLLKGTDTIDGIGERWKDPGSEWVVGSGSTKDYTLVRKSTVKGGQLDWNTGKGEWDVNANNTFTYLGKHTSDCYVPPIPQLSFAKGNIFVGEADGTVDVEVTIKSPSLSATTVKVYVVSGTAANGTDYNYTDSSVVTFPGGSTASQKLSISIADNASSAANKSFTLGLTEANNSATYGANSQVVVTIVNDDYRVSNIIGVRTSDGDLNITNKGEKVEVTGVVYGIDYDGNAGLSFTIIDSTAGVNIFNFNDVSDYIVTEGDMITVRGAMDFYNGLTEVFADSIRVISKGNSLKMPMEVSAPSEGTESNFIKVMKIWVTDTATIWPNNGNVWVTNEDKDTFQVRIDKDAVDIVGKPIQYDTMNITGIGGQFVVFAPYNKGYQVFPRRLSDIEQWVDRSSIAPINAIRSIYPNPSTGLVNIQTQQAIELVVISDMTGKIVMVQKMSPSTDLSIDLSHLNKGVYLIRVKGNGVESGAKVMLK